MPNSDTAMLHGRSGTFTKKGKVAAKGGKLLVSKEPLIGESKTGLSPRARGNQNEPIH
jgi:hypothetical protein